MVLLLASITAGCGGATKKVSLPAGISNNIFVLSLGADTSFLNGDQKALLQQTLDWMDKDLIQLLNRKGFTAGRIHDENEFTEANNGHLLKVSITDHKMIPKGARIWGGMMAGNDRLNAHYELVDKSGKTVMSWDDIQSSTRGGTYVAQALNINSADKIASYLGAN
jgi:hypothetical protein